MSERAEGSLRALLWASGCFALGICSWALTRTTRSAHNLIAQLAGWTGLVIFLLCGLVFIYVALLRIRRRRQGLGAGRM
jgi:hypothetical protein